MGGEREVTAHMTRSLGQSMVTWRRLGRAESQCVAHFSSLLTATRRHREKKNGCPKPCTKYIDKPVNFVVVTNQTEACPESGKHSHEKEGAFGVWRASLAGMKTTNTPYFSQHPPFTHALHPFVGSHSTDCRCTVQIHCKHVMLL